MAARKRTVAEADDIAQPPHLPSGKPIRLIAQDWPFLYSVLPNGDLVINKRLPVARKPKTNQTSTTRPDEVEQPAPF